jgi:hypothetical protein
MMKLLIEIGMMIRQIAIALCWLALLFWPLMPIGFLGLWMLEVKRSEG